MLSRASLGMSWTRCGLQNSSSIRRPSSVLNFNHIVYPPGKIRLTSVGYSPIGSRSLILISYSQISSNCHYGSFKFSEVWAQIVINRRKVGKECYSSSVGGYDQGGYIYFWLEVGLFPPHTPFCDATLLPHVVRIVGTVTSVSSHRGYLCRFSPYTFIRSSVLTHVFFERNASALILKRPETVFQGR